MSYLRRPQSVKTPDSLAIRGVCGFTLCVCLSVDGIMSALCLQQYLLDPFHIYPSYQANLECVLRVKSFFFFFFFYKIPKFEFLTTLALSCFDLVSIMNQ